MKAVYPGSFDPVTLGHLDLMRRGSLVFSELIVGVADNPRKTLLFPMKERVELIRAAISDLANVKVMPFRSLLVDFARENGARVILKGLRAVSDFEYELQMSLFNRRLDGNVETVFMMPSEEHSFISSSIVKEIAFHGGDVGEMVPAEVAAALYRKLGVKPPTKPKGKKR